jgi:hypothetical protein
VTARETERWLELARDVGEKVAGAVRDVVPPEAQAHLLNAQRELLTALFLIYEHQAGGRRRQAAGEEGRPRRRVTRIDVDEPPRRRPRARGSAGSRGDPGDPAR